MQFRVKSIAFYAQEVQFKKPFRFGAYSLERCPQVHTRVEIETADGKLFVGASAELVVPKWFDKRTSRTPEQNITDLYGALFFAREAMLSDPAMRSIFDHCQIATALLAGGQASAQLPGLVRSFGVAQIEKALMDALCGHAGLSFSQALRANLFGLRFDTPSSPDLKDFDADQFLYSLRPRENLYLRHTVGFDSPELDGQGEESYRRRLDALAMDVKRANVSYLKVKLCGDVQKDLARLEDVAEKLMHGGMRLTLDGNEQYQSVDDLTVLLEQMRLLEQRCEKPIFSNCLFVEQAFTREIALSTSLPQQALLRPLIIDESDDADVAFLQAKQCGYHGVSSKACKGVLRAVLNIARAQQWTMDEGLPYFVSPEDLCTQVGLAFQQDLALAAFSGSKHIERNGYQYVVPFSGWQEDSINKLITKHSDLYARNNDGKPGYRCSSNGIISCASVNQLVGFACAVRPDWAQLTLVEHA